MLINKLILIVLKNDANKYLGKNSTVKHTNQKYLYETEDPLISLPKHPSVKTVCQYQHRLAIFCFRGVIVFTRRSYSTASEEST